MPRTEPARPSPAPPRVSVVVPAYNAERFLGATLRSILAQSLAAWECVIVDDGSTDGTVAVAEAFAAEDARFRVMRQANARQATARNTGFGASDPAAPYVAFMDADDLWEPAALETLAAALDERPEWSGVHCLAEWIDADGGPIRPGEFADFGRARLGFDGRRIVTWPLSEPTSFAVTAWTPFYPPAVLLARRAACCAIGGFDAAVKHGEDWDFYIRLSRQGDIGFLDRTLAYYRRHDGNETNNPAVFVPWIRFIHWRTFFSEANTPEQRSLMRGGWRAWQKHKMRAKWADCRRSMAGGRPVQAGKSLGHIGAHAWRYLRGYPTPRGL